MYQFLLHEKHNCVHSNSELNAFVAPSKGASRSPCPALNVLANHGYIPRQGTNIPFWTLVQALKDVYNLTYRSALFLTTVGYLTSGHIGLRSPEHPSSDTNDNNKPSAWWNLASFLPWPSWTLDLSSLCTLGEFKIAHEASLVHSNASPTTIADSPNPALVSELLTSSRQRPAYGPHKTADGLTLADLGHIHAERKAHLPLRHALDYFHEQLALGECGLVWSVMHNSEGVIPEAEIKALFRHERLPSGWWGVNGGRPKKEVSLWEAKRRADEVGALAAT